MDHKDILEAIDKITESVKSAIAEHEDELNEITNMVDGLVDKVRDLNEKIGDVVHNLTEQASKIVNKDN